jgi:hypothetical protein
VARGIFTVSSARALKAAPAPRFAPLPADAGG